MNQLPKRLHSIDVFRAVTMLLMIFVNDSSGEKMIPGWIEHVSAKEDGLGFADTVFPAFLFIVGLSIPFAIRNRINKGDLFMNIAFYIGARAFALLVMGFFQVNSEDYSSAALLPRYAWIFFITVAFFLIWLDYPPKLSKTTKYGLVGTGVLLLAIMAYLFKGGDAEQPEGMHPSWWGILGIIGWAYLVSAFIFLLSKGKLPVLIAALIVFLLINIAAHTHIVHLNLPVIGDASAVSLVMSGMVISGIYDKLAGRNKDTTLWTILSIAGAGMIVAGLLIRPYAEGISKIRATPAWVLVCGGISILVFTLLIWLIDVKGKQRWFSIIRPAGTSTLTCYLIPYFQYALFGLLQVHYPSFINEGLAGLARSMLTAFLIIGLVGIMERHRLRLKI